MEKMASVIIAYFLDNTIVGAFVTRYISFEGMMPIREGNSEKYSTQIRPISLF